MDAKYQDLKAINSIEPKSYELTKTEFARIGPPCILNIFCVTYYLFIYLFIAPLGIELRAFNRTALYSECFAFLSPRAFWIIRA